MRWKTGAVGILALAAGAAVTAEAGETLRLRALGAIPLQDRAYGAKDLLASDAGSMESRQFVVQFFNAISEADRSALTAQGLEISRYLPEDALIVRGTESALALARIASSRIRAVAPFEPEWKLSPELLSPVAARGPELVSVAILPGASGPEAAAAIARVPGARILGVNDRDVAVSIPSSSLASLARVESVEWIERAPVIVDWFFPVDPPAPGERRVNELGQLADLTGHESGTRLMGFEAAWARGYDGTGQTASVADTGLDSGDLATIHPDFKRNLARGYNMGLGTETWADSNGHGTHVAGSVVGDGAASDGALRGGAHGAKLLFEGLWSSLLNGLMPGSDFNRLIGTVYKDGARVHSNSWGSMRIGEYDSMASRVDEFMWNNPDMLVLFAAGNSGVDKDRDGRIDESSIGSPATAKNVLTVGASENLMTSGGNQKKHKELRNGDKNWGVEPLASDTLSNNGDGLAAFSSRGPTRDGRIKPEIVAPGTNIVSTRSHHPSAGALWGEYNADYAYSGGTSMATPLVAGAATVLRQFLVEGRKIAQPSAAIVKAALMHTAHDLFPGQYGTGPKQELPTRRPNPNEGYGRVDMDAATALDGQSELIDDKAGLALSEEKTVRVTVGATGTLRATLAYTDAPASASAAKTLVNDLDLVVTGDGGQVFQKLDRVNNAEMLELSGLAPGAYSVTVRGVNVPQGRNGKQPYALVVTAGR